MNYRESITSKQHTDDSSSAILAEQTSHIFDALKYSLFATLINAVILTGVLWFSIDQTVLVIWLILTIVVSGFRASVNYYYQQNKFTSNNPGLWSKLFILGSVLAAGIWASASILLFPNEDIARQVFLAFVIGGMAGGSITSLAHIRSAVMLFLCISLFPLIIRFLYSGTELSVPMGIMLLVYTLVLLFNANRIYNILNQNISLKISSKKDQRSLELSDTQYKTLLDTATDSFFLHDINGRFLNVNHQACVALGYSRDELLKLSVTDIEVGPDPEVLKTFWPTLNKGEHIRIEGLHRRKDGSTFPVEVSLALIEIEDNQLFSVLARDISERKRIDKLKNEFISTVSHELRTPLTSIKGSLSLISNGAMGALPEKIADMLKIACNNTERLLLLINDILDIQKIESGGIEFEYEDTDIIPVIEESIAENKAYAEQYNVNLSLKITAIETGVYADKSRIKQVMANLISNAIKFSPSHDLVAVSVTNPKPEAIRISFTDHGPGIPDDFHDKIFNKFTQADSSDTRHKSGTGLGLNISQEIIRKHNGVIDYLCDENGTTFYFDLPASI